MYTISLYSSVIILYIIMYVYVTHTTKFSYFCITNKKLSIATSTCVGDAHSTGIVSTFGYLTSINQTLYWRFIRRTICSRKAF